MISNSPTLEELSIAPGEGKQIIDNFCEELAFPYLFPNGKFGYKVEREIKLIPVKFFNQRLLNFTQMFASDPDYVFFVLSVTQQMKLQRQIKIALKKVCTGRITAGMLPHNFSDTVKSFVANDEAYHSMNTIKGTAACWKRFLYEVLAIVKQLGIPTFFMTLSCADLHWNELISITAKLKWENLQEEHMNMNPVLFARHFQYRVEVFFLK